MMDNTIMNMPVINMPNDLSVISARGGKDEHSSWQTYGVH
jgi:hypothetical protein